MSRARCKPAHLRQLRGRGHHHGPRRPGQRNQDSVWKETAASFESPVRRNRCCFSVVVQLEYDSRLVQRGGRTYEQWRNLRYTSSSLGPRVACTGGEVGQLGCGNQWLSFSPPWLASGEVPASPPQQQSPNPQGNQSPRYNPFGESSSAPEQPASASPQYPYALLRALTEKM